MIRVLALLLLAMATVTIPTATLEALRRSAGMRPQFIHALHDGGQRSFVTDKSKRKTGRCGRRAGKTHGLASWFVDGMLEKPGERSLYIALTRPRARQILWDTVLRKMIATHRLPLKLATRDGQLMVEHANGSSLWLAGCNDKSEVDKFRGEPFYRIAIDEAQAFPDFLQELVEESLEPCLWDLQGQIALTGTPGAVCAGYFYEVTSGLHAGWANYHWTVLDNAFFPNAAADLEELRRARGWDEQHPTYRREYMGEWFEDASALIYPLTWELNAWKGQDDTPYGLPPGDYSFGLGVDLGFADSSTAFTLAAKRIGYGEVYILRSYTRSRLIPTALAAHVQTIRREVHDESGKGCTVVVDEGALGKGYAEQMRVMGVACEPAQKTEKRSYQEFVRGLILTGALKADFGACRELLDEARKLQFDPETGLEDERYRRHCCDSLLYIVRHLVPRYDPELNPPPPGSKEAIEAEMKAYRQKLIKDREKRQRRTG